MNDSVEKLNPTKPTGPTVLSVTGSWIVFALILTGFAVFASITYIGADSTVSAAAGPTRAESPILKVVILPDEIKRIGEGLQSINNSQLKPLPTPVGRSFKVVCYPVYADNKVVPRVNLVVTNRATGYRAASSHRGKFVLSLPAGQYDFVMKDENGYVNKYLNLVVDSDTSIKFMFGLFKPTPPPTATLSATPNTINTGESATLSWSTENVTSVRINNGVGDVDSHGSLRVSPSLTRKYTISASGISGTVSKSVTITVTEPPDDAPSATFRVSSGSIKQGESTTLTWAVENATSVSINQGVGNLESDGSITVSPSSTKTYSLTASNSAGSVRRDITITVATPPEPSPTIKPPGPSPTIGPPGPSPSVEPPRPTPDDRTATVIDTPTPSPIPSPSDSASPQNGGGEVNKDPEFWSTTEKIALWSLLMLLLGGLGWAIWLALPTIIPAAAAGLSALGLAGVTGKGDDVHCTLYSQPEVNAGSDLLVQVFAHLLEQAEELDELAEELDPDAQKQLSKKLKKQIKHDSVLTFKLMIPGIELDEDEQDIIWQGEPDSVEFIVSIPEDHGAGKRFGRVFVYENGDQIGKIPFRINIMPKELQLPQRAEEPEVAGVMTTNPTAFVSYASRDKDSVYRFVQLMDGLKYDYHIDIFHIDAGDRWEQKLYEFIDKDDVFLLFWSEAASQSHWVLKEAQLAKERMSTAENGLPRIIIYKLDEKTAVPEFLNDIHVDRKWAGIIGEIDKQKAGGGPNVG